MSLVGLREEQGSGSNMARGVSKQGRQQEKCILWCCLEPSRHCKDLEFSSSVIWEALWYLDRRRLGSYYGKEEKATPAVIGDISVLGYDRTK